MNETPFSRTRLHDPAELNDLAQILRDGSGFLTFTERYGIAVLILESDWLKGVIAKAEQDGREDNADHGMCYVAGSRALRLKRAEAWDEGHATPPVPDTSRVCQCYAHSAFECGCGNFDATVPADNPYRSEP